MSLAQSESEVVLTYTLGVIAGLPADKRESVESVAAQLRAIIEAAGPEIGGYALALVGAEASL